MRLLKGFGKNYFTLTAIQASVAQVTMHSRYVSIQRTLHVSFTDEDSLEEEPPKEPVLVPLSLNSKASHCSCFYTLASHLVIKNQSIENCYIKQFLRTDSVSSPPKLLHNFAKYTKTKNQGKI